MRKDDEGLRAAWVSSRPGILMLRTHILFLPPSCYSCYSVEYPCVQSMDGCNNTLVFEISFHVLHRETISSPTESRYSNSVQNE